MTIYELEAWFAKAPKPSTSLMLLPGTTINDIDHFLESHFIPLKREPANKIHQPLLDRLKALKLLIESNM